MELNQLKCFLAVARERNFTRAAKARHMTQPSLSYQITKLEEELGTALFLRKPRTIELSQAGKLLLESAVKIVDEEDSIVSKFKLRENLEEGEVRFGIIPTMAPYLLPPLLREFREDFPAIAITASESRTSQLVKEVVAGDLEFAVVSDIDKAVLKKYSLHLSHLFNESLLLATSGNHPLCSQERLTPKSIDRRELILLTEGNCLRDQTLELCQPSEGTSSLVCEQVPTQLSMVESALGIAIVPEMAIRESLPKGVALTRFDEPQPKRMIGLLKKRASKLSAAARELVDRLKRNVLQT